MTLILPTGFKSNKRPLANEATSALIAELKHRQILAEYTGRIAMPNMPLDNEEAKAQMRLEQFRAMAHQLGEALIQSPFVFCSSSFIEQIEVLQLQCVVCRHPKNESSEVQSLGGDPGNSTPITGVN